MYPDVLLSFTLKLLELWNESFKKRPVHTTILSIIAAVVLATAVYAINLRNEELQRGAEAERLANLDLNQQIQELDRVHDSLQNLITFVEDQRKKVTVEQEIIAKLTQERAQLEPIVQQDRAIIEQILALQAQRQVEQAERDKWVERGFGFVTGIVSSMVASFLYASAMAKRRKGVGKPPPPSAPPASSPPTP